MIVEKIPSGYFHAYFRHGGLLKDVILNILRVYPDGSEVHIDSVKFQTLGENVNLKNETVFNTYAVTIDLS